MAEEENKENGAQAPEAPVENEDAAGEVTREEFDGLVGLVTQQAEVLSEIQQAIAELTGAAQDPVEGEGQMDEDDPTVSMSDQLAKQQQQIESLVRRLQASEDARVKERATAVLASSGLQLSDEQTKSLHALALKDSALFDSTVKTMSDVASKAKKLSDTPRNPYAFGEVGITGETSGGVESAFRALCDEVAKTEAVKSCKDAGERRKVARSLINEKKAVNWLDDRDVAKKLPVMDEYFPRT